MGSGLRSLGQRLALVLVFCAINAIFFFAAWKAHEWRTPSYRAVKTLAASRAQGAGVMRALFSPDDNVEDILLTLIQEEKEFLGVAAFSLTNARIAQALVDAADRGVKVEVVVDEENSLTSYSKVCLLHNHPIPVWLYPSKKSPAGGKRTGIMHHKFIIFKKTLGGKSLLWTGSFNFTRSANDVNQENVIVLDDPQIFAAFNKQFELLKNRSVAMRCKMSR